MFLAPPTYPEEVKRGDVVILYAPNAHGKFIVTHLGVVDSSLWNERSSDRISVVGYVSRGAKSSKGIFISNGRPWYRVVASGFAGDEHPAGEGDEHPTDEDNEALMLPDFFKYLLSSFPSLLTPPNGRKRLHTDDLVVVYSAEGVITDIGFVDQVALTPEKIRGGRVAATLKYSAAGKVFVTSLGVTPNVRVAY